MSANYKAKYQYTRTLPMGRAPQFLLVAGVVGDTSRRRCELAAREDLQMALVISSHTVETDCASRGYGGAWFPQKERAHPRAGNVLPYPEANSGRLHFITSAK